MNPTPLPPIKIDLSNRPSTTSKKTKQLPETYANVKPISSIPSTPLNSPLFAPVCTINVPVPGGNAIDVVMMEALTHEREWLEGVHTALSSDLCKSWAQHHAAKNRCDSSYTGINAILPIISNEVHKIETQHHCMTITKDTINKLNPGQTPLDVSDQPVYALSKTIQWRFNNQFGQGEYFVMFGALHIEKSLLVIHEDIIKCSGLKQILQENELSVVGTVVIVNVNDIKKARYCIQVCACAIYKKLKEAHKESNSILPVMDWLQKVRSNQSEMSFYWNIILHVEVSILVFIRSIREGNFTLYKQSLWSLMKWYFALDHYNYARWLTVHLFDLTCLEFTCPDIYNEFMKGNFTYQKTRAKFSKMAPDQNNEKIKGVGGAVHLVNREDESGLIKWELCGPELVMIVDEFEQSIQTRDASNEPIKHHEDSLSYQNHFYNDVQNVIDGMVANPFKLDKLTTINNIQKVFEALVYEGISSLAHVGEKQFLRFWEERLLTGKTPIGEKINKNVIILPGTVKKENDNARLVYSAGLLTKLQSAIHFRRSSAEALFSSEIFGVAQCIAETSSQLYHAKKSVMLKKFKPWIVYKLEGGHTKAAMVVELSALIHIYADAPVNTFSDFAKLLITK